MPKLRCFAIAILSLLCHSNLTFAQSYLVPDSSFNGTGFVAYKRQSTDLTAFKIIPAAQGGVVAGGFIMDSLAVWSYTASGALDPSFGNGGYTAVKVGRTLFPTDLARQRDGKIVLLASARLSYYSTPLDSAQYEIALLRLNPDGSPDASFGTNGLLLDNPTPAFQYNAQCLTIDTFGPDDRIYVGTEVLGTGHTACSTGNWQQFCQWAITKYTPSGSRDSSFNATGIYQQPASDISPGAIMPFAQPMAMIVSSDHKLLVAGALSGFDTAFFCLRMNPDGTYDNSYGTLGRNVYPDSHASIDLDWLSNCKIAADHSILFFARDYSLQNNDSFLYDIIKIAPNGNRDMNYAGSGILSYVGPFVMGKVLDNDDRLIVARYSSANGNSQKIRFERFTKDGMKDLSFGNNGEVISEPVLNDIYLNPSYVQGMVWDKDHNTLALCAHRSNIGFGLHFGLFKYKSPAATGIKDPTENQFKLSVYPNPASDQLKIVSDRLLNYYSIYDLNGRLLSERKLLPARESTDIDINKIGSGQYILNIETADGRKVCRSFIK